jgi:hypothetical protein
VGIERLVDRGEEIFCEVWHESGNAVEVEGCISRRKSPEQVAMLPISL